MRTERANPIPVIVGAAIVSDGRVLACARARPPELAGFWEFPGGKVEAGETEAAAVIRECREELGVHVTVGERVGMDVPLPRIGAMLRVFTATLVTDEPPRALEHAQLRWLTAAELDSVPWLPADAPIVAALRPLLAPGVSPCPAAGGGS